MINKENISNEEVIARIHVSNDEEKNQECCKLAHKLQIYKRKTRPRFWTNLFGEKECKCCKQVESQCACKKIVTDKYTQVNLSEKDLNEGKSELKQKDLERKLNNMVKYTSPLEKRGCGAHVYFCIGNERNKCQVKKKHAIERDNERIKTCKQATTMKCEKNRIPEDNTLDNTHKVTILCEEEKEELKNNSATSNVPTIGSSIYREIEQNMAKEYDKQRFDSSLSSVSPNNNFPFQVRKVTEVYEEQSKNESPATSEEQTEKFKNSIIEEVEETSKHSETTEKDLSRGIRDIILKENRPENSKNIKTSEQLVHVKHQSILRNNTKPHLDKDNVTVGAMLGPGLLKFLSKDEEISSTNVSVLSEREHFKGKHIPRKSTYRSGIFARNSLISLRKDRKQSALEGRISLIVEKLTNIEDKINELEKNQTNNKIKNTQTDNSCNNKSSAPLKEDENNEKGTIHKSNPKGNIRKKCENDIELIKKDNGLYINVPKNVTVIKKKKRPVNDDEIKRVMHHNAYEIEASNIASTHFSTIKCNNPHVFIDCPNTKHKDGQNKPPRDKWHRISEELKISGTNLSVKN